MCFLILLVEVGRLSRMDFEISGEAEKRAWRADYFSVGTKVAVTAGVTWYKRF
jgi:hypothetical protein